MEQSKRKQLLKLIESDCRLSMEEYAVMLGEDEVIVSAEIKRQEEEKIICVPETSGIDARLVEINFEISLIFRPCSSKIKSKPPLTKKKDFTSGNLRTRSAISR